MKAMILAAGRGERMRPLTDVLPKPLLTVSGKPLIVYHIEKLAAAGISDIIINIAYLGEKIRQALGDGSRWGVQLHYSQEPEPLETGGALLHALSLLGDEPFILVNGDVWTDFDFSILIQHALTDHACLVLVNNPEHNHTGDFSLDQQRVIAKGLSSATYTFSGIALVDPQLIIEYPEKRTIFPLREAFTYAIAQNKLAAVTYQGQWCDVGTPERLRSLESDPA